MEIKRTLTVQSTRDGLNYTYEEKPIIIMKEPYEEGDTVIRGLFPDVDITLSEIESILEDMQYIDKKKD